MGRKDWIGMPARKKYNNKNKEGKKPEKRRSVLYRFAQTPDRTSQICYCRSADKQQKISHQPGTLNVRGKALQNFTISIKCQMKCQKIAIYATNPESVDNHNSNIDGGSNNSQFQV